MSFETAFRSVERVNLYYRLTVRSRSYNLQLNTGKQDILIRRYWLLRPGGNLQSHEFDRVEGAETTDQGTVGRLHYRDTEMDSMDTTFEILSNPRRRNTISYLAQSDTEMVHLRDLAEQIAAWENGVSMQEVKYNERKRVYTSLYQTHLPKMDRLGIIEYDRSSGVVRPTPEVMELYGYFARESDDEGLLTRVSLSLSISCLALVALIATNVVTLGGVTGVEIALLVALVFVAVSIAQVLTT